jgi:hypothetical protein
LGGGGGEPNFVFLERREGGGNQDMPNDRFFSNFFGFLRKEKTSSSRTYTLAF